MFVNAGIERLVVEVQRRPLRGESLRYVYFQLLINLQPS